MIFLRYVALFFCLVFVFMVLFLGNGAAAEVRDGEGPVRFCTLNGVQCRRGRKVVEGGKIHCIIYRYLRVI